MLLVYLAVAWLAGIVLARAIEPAWQVLLLAALVGVVVRVLDRRHAYARIGAACLITAVLGAGRMTLATPKFDDGSLAAYNGAGRVVVEGVIVGEPDEREGYTNLRVRAERIERPDGTTQSVHGLALVRTDRYPQREYGDRLVVEGHVESPPATGDFSHRDYLARQGIHSMFAWAEVRLIARNQASPIRYHLLRFKRRARGVLGTTLPEPQAALATGILLGVDTGIPRDLMDDFAATGTMHIIAISGFNITTVAGLIAALAWRLVGRRRAFWLASAGVIAYTLLVGASASVVRAAVMAFLFLWARYLGRLSSAPVSLGAAAIGMTAHNPYLVWDVGFQLSVVATLGLMVYAKPLERGLRRVLSRFGPPDDGDGRPGLLSDALATTVAATITTMPLILYYFGRLSFVTVLANALVLPAQPYVIVWGGLSTLGGLVARPLGQLFGWVAWVFLTFTVEAVRLMARVPFASIPLQMSGSAVVVYYSLLGALTLWFAQNPERRSELRSRLLSRPWTKTAVVTAIVLLVLVAAWWRARPDGLLHVAFLDVGQGDAIFVQTPAGRQVLVDGGPSESAVLDELGRQMPFWDRTLDALVLTHADLDHIAGLLPVLERYRVDRIVYRDVGANSAEYKRWVALVEAEQADVHSGESGLQLDLGAGVVLSVLHPGADLDDSGGFGYNNASVVVRLAYGAVSVLLPGDIEARVEGDLITRGAPLASTVLKAAHHGSCTSTTDAFLSAVAPDVVVISVGENDFGHPCDAVLERLDEHGQRRGQDLPVYRTDEDGTVEVITDGAQVWVRTERQRTQR